MSDALTKLECSPTYRPRATSSPIPSPPPLYHTNPVVCNAGTQAIPSFVTQDAVTLPLADGMYMATGVGQNSAAFAQGRHGADTGRLPDALLPTALPPSIMPSDVAEPASHPDRYTDFLGRIEQRQDELRDARENLLGARVRLQRQRAQLRLTREEATTQAGMVFNLIRTHLLKIGLDLPADIDTVLAKADASRDTLGTQELEYEEAEKSYNSEEWKYTEKEAQFIEDLPINAPTPSAPLAHMHAAESFRHFSYDPQDVAYMVAESEGGSVPTILQPDEPTSHQMNQAAGQANSDMKEHTPPLTATQPLREQVTPQLQVSSVTDTAPQAVIDTLLSHPRLKWSETLHNIDDWLYQSLSSSNIEKERLKKLMPPTGLSDKAWLTIVHKYWHSESSGDIDFHTGDTTVSDENFSQAVSSNTMKRLFNLSEASEYEAQTIPPMSVLAQERVLDVPDLEHFPKTIKRRDLVEKTVKHVSFSVRSSSTHSGSTQHTNLTRTSSHQDCSSISTIDESLSSASSDDGKTVRSEKQASAHNTEANDQAGRSTEEPPSLGEIKPPMLWVMAEHQSLSSEKFDYVQNLTTPGDHPQLEHDGASPLPESELEYAGAANSMKPANHSYSPKVIHVEQESSISTDSYFPDVQIQSESSLEPYIRVKSPRPWTLPLLRLTALPTPPRQSSPVIDHAMTLKHTPFVTLPDVPFRLPGPSRYSTAPRLHHTNGDLT